MNEFVKENKNIKLYDKVKIDNIDRIFDPSAYYRGNSSNQNSQNIYNIDDIDTDTAGEYISIHNPTDSFSIYRFNLSLVNSKYNHIEPKSIRYGKRVFIGKDISYAPIIKHWNLLDELSRIDVNDYLDSQYYNNERYINEWFNFNELYAFKYEILEYKDNYVLIKNNDKNINLIFPYWFLYEEEKPSYKPKKIKRFLDF